MAKKKVGEIIRISLSIPLWLIITAGVAIILIMYFTTAQYRDHVKFATLLLGGASAMYSAYYVGAALRLNVGRDKQRASFELLELLNRPEFVDVRNFIEKEVEGHEDLSASDLYRKVSDNKELENAVTIVLGILEDTSIAIRYEYVDEDILYMSLIAIATRNFHGLRGYIELLRKDKATDYYFTELEKLCSAWESGRRLSDGKPVPSFT